VSHTRREQKTHPGVYGKGHQQEAVHAIADLNNAPLNLLIMTENCNVLINMRSH